MLSAMIVILNGINASPPLLTILILPSSTCPASSISAKISYSILHLFPINCSVTMFRYSFVEYTIPLSSKSCSQKTSKLPRIVLPSSIDSSISNTDVSISGTLYSIIPRDNLPTSSFKKNTSLHLQHTYKLITYFTIFINLRQKNVYFSLRPVNTVVQRNDSHNHE